MGTVYLRQLKYIPANMGVILVGEVPKGESFSDYATLNFSLREAPAEMPLEGDNYTAVWTKADEYAGQEWNNYLKPTVTAIDKLGNADTDADGKYSIASSVLQTSIPLTITSRMGQETTISVSSALRRMAEAAQTKLT